MGLDDEQVVYDELKNRFPKFVRWGKSLFYDFHRRIIIREGIHDEKSVDVYLYTDKYMYIITVTDTYLGCILKNRRSLPGETWLRGSDLPDGKNNIKTWNAIVNSIVRNEICYVKDTPEVRGVPELNIPPLTA